MLVGVGDDGHVGSLYPDRDEVLVSGGEQWVLPVDMKQPGSITLSLVSVMGNSPAHVRPFRVFNEASSVCRVRSCFDLSQPFQPVMAGAKEVVIAACGVSEKYPQVSAHPKPSSDLDIVRVVTAVDPSCINSIR